jgi:antitoxin (DNA-binding transcriptional repressor) of toxin-antitoxin stability system
MNGEEIVIAKSGKPVAVLMPLAQSPAPRIPGIDAGKVVIGPDFDAPLKAGLFSLSLPNGIWRTAWRTSGFSPCPLS